LLANLATRATVVGIRRTVIERLEAAV